MLSIGIYCQNRDYFVELRSLIQDFIIETRLIAKMQHVSDLDDLLSPFNNYDIYIVDMDAQPNIDIIELSKKIRNDDRGAQVIYLSSDPSTAISAIKARVHYYLLKPIDTDELLDILKEIKKKIQEDSIIIKTYCGERRIRIAHLNYINIVKRCLCYHLTDGAVFDGQVLRSSFEKAINPLQLNKLFIFIAPSLLINVSTIKILDKDHIIFENDDILYYPVKHHEEIRTAWRTYNKVTN